MASREPVLAPEGTEALAKVLHWVMTSTSMVGFPGNPKSLRQRFSQEQSSYKPQALVSRNMFNQHINGQVVNEFNGM